MASQNPHSSNFPTSMGPGARPIQPGEASGSILRELQDIRASYSINVDSEALRLGYNFRGQDRRYNIPFTSIPLSDGSRWLLYGGTGRAKVTGLFTLDMIRGAENMAGRPLTQTEVEGFAYHASKRMRYNFLGTVSGFGIGYAIAARTWKTMKFPFMKTKPIESYDYFPSQRMAILRGGYARITWQITRANLYAALSLVLAQTIIGSMGDSIMTVGLYRDTRTQDVVKAVKGGFDRIRMNRSQPGQAPPVPQQPQGHDQDPQERDFYGNEGRGLENDYQRDDSYGGDTMYSDSTSDARMLDDSTMRQREKQHETQAPTEVQASPASDGGSRSAFFFDDASPTAGNDPDMTTPRSYQPTSNVSVWDRIRRGGQPQPQRTLESSQQAEAGGQPQQTGGWRRSSPQVGETKGDSFSFSSSDEERQLAKSQAQKEFDAMLDRERREGGSEGYTSGSFAAETGSETPAQTGGSIWERRRRGGS